jgi:hypothetical protein
MHSDAASQGGGWCALARLTIAATSTAVDLWIIISAPFVAPFVPFAET